MNFISINDIISGIICMIDLLITKVIKSLCFIEFQIIDEFYFN